MSASYKPVTHVIFDMDGLILDTEPLYTQAVETVAARHGAHIQTLSWDLKVRQLGLPSDKLAELLVREMGIPVTPQQFTKELKEVQEHTFPSCQVLPGAEALITHLHEAGVPLALATSCPEVTFKLKTSRHQSLFSMFGHIVCGSSDPEVVRGKPAPDIFMVCAQRFLGGQVRPENCLVYEDSPAGVTAALSAGMQVVMVPDVRMWETPQFMPQPPPTQAIKSLSEFKPQDFGLPAFSKV